MHSFNSLMGHALVSPLVVIASEITEFARLQTDVDANSVSTPLEIATIFEDLASSASQVSAVQQWCFEASAHAFELFLGPNRDIVSLIIITLNK